MPRTSYKSCLFASLLLQWKEQQLMPWGHLTPAEKEDIIVTLEVQIFFTVYNCIVYLATTKMNTSS